MPTDSPEESRTSPEENQNQTNTQTEDQPESHENESDSGPYPDQEYGPVTAVSEDELDFLNKKGAIEILAQLADGPKQFTEIDNALVISHGTVSTRLTKGAKLGLWEEEFEYPDDGGKIKLYQLTPHGRTIAEIAKAENVDKTTEQKKKATEQHADAVSAVHEHLTTDSGHDE